MTKKCRDCGQTVEKGGLCEECKEEEEALDGFEEEEPKDL